MKRFLQKKLKALSVIAVAATFIILFPASVRAAENEECLVLVYAEQEGMGKITSSCNGTVFQDSISARQGDIIQVSVNVYPRCTFEGWKKDGEIKSKQYSYSFTAQGPMCIVTANFRQSRDYVEYTSKSFLQDISTTNWSNRTCRFAENSGTNDVAVTTAMASQGEQCIAAFNTVLEDFTLARTYNITFTKYYNKNLERLENAASLVFQIPKELLAPGRVFRMINVCEGQPTVLEDTDSSDTTITFQGQNAGAYALVYRDTPAAIPTPEELEQIDPGFSVTPFEDAGLIDPGLTAAQAVN